MHCTHFKGRALEEFQDFNFHLHVETGVFPIRKCLIHCLNTAVLQLTALGSSAKIVSKISSSFFSIGYRN